MPLLILVTVAWGAGLVTAHHWLAPAGVGPFALALLSLIPLSAIVLWRHDRGLIVGGTCALVFLVGAMRYQAALPNFENLRFVGHYNGLGWVTVEGVVRSYPDVRDTWVNVYFDAESIEFEGQAHPVAGTVLVRSPLLPEVRYGDRLQVSGQLEAPLEAEEFSYRDYLARKGIYSVLWHPQIVRTATDQGSRFWAGLYTLRDRSRHVIARLVPSPEASLLQGILLGIRSGIPADLLNAFNATSTSHIIVISGANIVIIAGILAHTLGRILGTRRATWFVVAGIALYVLLAGADAPVVRAGVMGVLYVVARHLGRASTAFVSLCASAWLLTAINPLVLWDIGFQLSFLAALSLVLFSSPIQSRLDHLWERWSAGQRARVLPRAVGDLLVVTLAAQLLTIPLVVYTFGRLSLVGPLANLLIAPVQPVIMTWGGIATLVGLLPVVGAAAFIPAWVAWLCLAYTAAVVQWLATWPFASIQVGHVGAGWIAVAWGVLLLAGWALTRHRDALRQLWAWFADRWPTKALWGILVATALLVWLAVGQLPDGRLHLAFLDVGQGDAILITTPQGQQILVDGGPSPTALTSSLGKEMPFWDRSIDLVVATHPDTDHMAGLPEVLERYRVGAWLDARPVPDDALVTACQSLVAKTGAHYQVAAAGQSFRLSSDLRMDVLHPPPRRPGSEDNDSNSNSVVLRVVWGEVSFLLTGDIGANEERLLLESGLPLQASVLKVAHHGSDASSSSGFLAAVNPRFAVISVGAGNRSGHPAPAVLDRLAQLDSVVILRTDQQGRVEFTTDGQRLWSHTEH